VYPGPVHTTSATRVADGDRVLRIAKLVLTSILLKSHIGIDCSMETFDPHPRRSAMGARITIAAFMLSAVSVGR
jgi:hypothetical protein